MVVLWALVLWSLGVLFGRQPEVSIVPWFAPVAFPECLAAVLVLVLSGLNALRGSEVRHHIH